MLPPRPPRPESVVRRPVRHTPPMRLSMSLVLIAGLGAGPACEGSGAASSDREASASERAGGIPLPGDCRAAWWDPAEKRLFLTDVTHDELIEWREGAGFSTVAKLPPASSLDGV